MKKVFLILTAVFIILTFTGAGYVLHSRGSANAGYAVVPMLFALVFMTFYRRKA